MLQHYYRINEVTGVSIHLSQDESQQIAACGLAAEKNSLQFVKKVTGLTSPEELKKQFPGKKIIAVNLTGKGILTKKIKAEETVGPAVFSAIIPNGKIEDFYIQHFSSGQWSFVSLIRRSEADKWLMRLHELGFQVLQLSLGPFPVDHVLGQLNIYDEQITFDGHLIERNVAKEWENVKYVAGSRSPFGIKAENEPMKESLLLAYAAGFQLLLSGQLEPVRAEVPRLVTALGEKTLHIKLKVNGLMFLLLFFILLLINLVWLSALTASNEQLARQVSSSTQYTRNVAALEEQVSNKEALLEKLGWEGGSLKSRYIDQIAQVLPDGVTWKEISLDPVDPLATRRDKSLRFWRRMIRVTGESQNISPVNEWMARVRTKAWVKNIQLDNYTFNNELSTGQFVVLISY